MDFLCHDSECDFIWARISNIKELDNSKYASTNGSPKNFKEVLRHGLYAEPLMEPSVNLLQRFLEELTRGSSARFIYGTFIEPLKNLLQRFFGRTYLRFFNKFFTKNLFKVLHKELIEGSTKVLHQEPVQGSHQEPVQGSSPRTCQRT